MNVTQYFTHFFLSGPFEPYIDYLNWDDLIEKHQLLDGDLVLVLLLPPLELPDKKSCHWRKMCGCQYIGSLYEEFQSTDNTSK